MWVLTATVGLTADRVRVVTTLPDLADFTRQLGGDRVDVTCLLTGFEDVHTYEPKVSDVRAVAGARLLISVGLGLEEWLQGLVQNAGNSKLLLVEASKGVSLIREDTKTGERAEPGHRHEGANPHVWLDPANAEVLCRNIAAALEAVDGTAADFYRTRLAAYVKKLNATAASLRVAVSALKDKRFLSYHPAWPYLARGLGFRLVGVVTQDPSQEPSARALAALISRIRTEKIRVLVTEPQMPSKVPDLLAKETGIRVITLSDMVGYGGSKTHLENMERNARALVAALSEAGR
jgi:ABC-type Zn uptake system ZnuABC Zn-binding protein ZnuA